MGKALQIRVSAVTWDEGLPEELWPQLFELAKSVPSSEKKLGVLEMVTRLGDGLQFMKWNEERKSALDKGITQAVSTAKSLEKALGDWDPRTANSLSDTLEDILTTLEQNFR